VVCGALARDLEQRSEFDILDMAGAERQRFVFVSAGLTSDQHVQRDRVRALVGGSHRRPDGTPHPTLSP
jgi:hypothetical protein